MKLGGAIMVKDFALLNRAIRSLQYCCDSIVVGIDNESAETGMILDECRAKNVMVEMFNFDGFGPVCNRLARLLHGKYQCDWIMHLDADEEIHETQSRMIRDYADNPGLGDAFSFPRRNYTRFDGSSERKDLWPDRQTRLHRWDVAYAYRSHPSIDPNVWKVFYLHGVEIHHYCFAMRTLDQWDAVHRFYGEMLWYDIQEGRVWTGPDSEVVEPSEESKSGPEPWRRCSATAACTR